VFFGENCLSLSANPNPSVGEEMQMCFIWKVQAGTTGDEDEVEVSPEGEVEASPEEGEEEDFQI